MTTSTFDQYVATQDARNTIQLNVIKWSYSLCDALLQNFIDYSIKSHQNSIDRLQGNTDTGISYHQKQIDNLKANICNYSFVIESGRKYHKIIMVIDSDSDSCLPPQRSIHAFIDRVTGDIFKPASWKSPAKHIRYNLLNIQSREYVLKYADWSGSYLYLK